MKEVPPDPPQELLGKRILGVAFAHPESLSIPPWGPRLTAVRSRSGSDTTLWCHSRPSRRFATPFMSWSAKTVAPKVKTIKGVDRGRNFGV